MSQTIRILAAPAGRAPTSKGLARSAAGSVVADVNLDTLKANIDQLRAQVAELFAAEERGSGFRLKQVDAGIEITAEGGVRLIGSLTIGAKAAVTLTFERE
jgi:hypothetical protein